MVEYLTYKGNEEPVRVSYMVLKRVRQHLKAQGTELSTMNVASMDMEVLEVMLYYALQRGYQVQGKESPYKLEEMEEMLDFVLADFTKAISSFQAPKPDKPAAGGNPPAPSEGQTN